MRLQLLRPKLASGLLLLWAGFSLPAQGQEQSPSTLASLPLHTWVKLTPLKETPPSPRLGYEGACVWDSAHQRLIRYGGHNQGGGGEQNSEIWTFDPRTATWELKETNTSPPGICCGQQNVFDPRLKRYVRFPAFSASHGWQWMREVYLNDASVWTYDLAENTWRAMRPIPTVSPKPLRCAAWDAEHQVIVMFGGEGSREGTCVYDPWTNTWTRMNPALEPEHRSGGNMAYDARAKLHVLFGSQFDKDLDTWAYELRTNTWRKLQPKTSPPTNKNDAVLTYDASAGKIVCIVKQTVGEEEDAKSQLETWTFDLAQNQWTKLAPQREPDSSGSRARQLQYATQLGVSLLENRPSNSSGNGEQQIWALKLSPSESKTPDVAPPEDVSVTTKANSAIVTWTKAAGKPQGYAIYRGNGEQPWLVDYAKLATLAGDATSYEDASLKPETVYFYDVRAVDKDGRESTHGTTIRTQPRFVEDLVVSVRSAKRVELHWKARPGEDVAGYIVERAPVEVLSEDQLTRLKAQTDPLESPSVGAVRRIGAFTTLTTTPIAATKFVDDTVNLEQPAENQGEPLYERNFHAEQLDVDGRHYRYGVYAYRVRAVNKLGVAGGPSPAVLTIPSSPAHVYAKDGDDVCQLKWNANPEAGIVGYRVYRMNGRFNKEPIPRLTSEPIVDTTYEDQTPKNITRRYYIVAVDVLGQEGFPSSPVWRSREWQSYYVPFTREWHQ